MQKQDDAMSTHAEESLTSHSDPVIRAVLFDFGGVLAEEGFRAGLRSIARLNGLDPESVHRKGIDAVYESGYVTGRAKEADFWKLMRGRFRFNEANTALTNIILDRFTLRPEMIDLVRDLRGRGLTCAILSDQTDWLDRLDRRYGFYREFDRVYCSYRLGKSKREPILFDEVVADLSLRPGEALFLDDDPGNVERARSRGLKVLCCDAATQCRAGLQDMLGLGI
jgi:putative hydrolase of the HAD superfamily